MPSARQRPRSDSIPFFHDPNLDAIGEGLPHHELMTTDIGIGGAMGVLHNGDSAALDKVLVQLGHVGWVALDWGEGDTDRSHQCHGRLFPGG